MDSKKIGLDIQINFFKFFFDSDYMHYGYWTPELKAIAPNFKQAQENYTNFLLEHIPQGVNTILDIGCGSGKVSDVLLSKGYNVTCVSPPCNMTDLAAERLKGRAVVHHFPFEEYKDQHQYDLALFSESYQYIDMRKGFANCAGLLKQGGYMLLSDFFRTEAEGKSPLGGGHRLTEFYEILKDQPFDIVEDIDITPQIAPTMTLINDLTMKVVYPGVQLVGNLIESRHPWVYKFLMWKFKKKIEKNRIKHFSGQRNPENFMKYKSYRLILLRKR